MPAIVLVMGKKEGCNKMSKKTHFVTAPFLSFKFVVFSLQQMVKNSSQLLQTAPYYKLCVISQLVVHRFLICFFRLFLYLLCFIRIDGFFEFTEALPQSPADGRQFPRSEYDQGDD